ncbi:hypothetical protein AMATHDRAFT_42658 [Amanita thiersii Skay4041]|uniref:Insecticide toxin TcdB middle/N-terminal domain-containing protein n=1 Tax=Amanita thiersii Skay4041 TaxID=703135 RepID=A0A2A9NJG5_9AGAR|nr:hypothetical protein AMATHDRAFT_42658 [Amanita thiersii Skay4041]
MGDSVTSLVSITNTGQKDLIFKSGDHVSITIPAAQTGTLSILPIPYEVNIKGERTVIATVRFSDNQSIRIKKRATVDGAAFICQAQVSQSNNIIAPISINESIDASGSLALNVPLQLPHSRFTPEVSLGYNSASAGHSVLGSGWNLLGVPSIERIPATIAQDGRRGELDYHSTLLSLNHHKGVENYDKYDCYALSGQRLIKISGKINNRIEYRFELEQWSRVFAYGQDVGNPTHWEQYLPDGTIRKFGDTQDSNIKALTGVDNPPTRVWAVSKFIDPFQNNITFKYTDLVKPSERPTGAYYLQQITFGTNSRSSALPKEFRVLFEYENRSDILVRYFGGYKIKYDWRMKSATTVVYTTDGAISDQVLKYTFAYSEAPLTKLSCLTSITLQDRVTGVLTNPLEFTWTGSAPSPVFEPAKQIAEISDLTSVDQIIPLDTNGDGSNDIVVSSNQDNVLSLDVYLADLKGKVSNTKATGSGPIVGLPFSSMIYPLDFNGDGISDFLHIEEKSDGTYALTAVLSKPNRQNPHAVKFEKQTTVLFDPTVAGKGGNFETGDFSGNGYVGLAYIYQDSTTKLIKVVQFTSDGTQLNKLSPVDIPGTETWDFSKVQIVVGSLTGSGVSELLVLYPDDKSWKLFWIQSTNGILGRKSDLSGIAAGVQVVSETQVLPFNADNDAKTGLLFVMSNNGNLRFQLLRSTGTSLFDSGAVDFTVPYSGNVSVNRVSSANTLDVVNVTSGDMGPIVNVFRFDSQTFYKIDNTTQPGVGSKNSLVRWADLRGICRSDCVIATVDDSGKLVLNSMQCSGTKYRGDRWQPLDCVSSYSQGLRYSSHVFYTPLSDLSIYQSDDRKVSSLVNAFAFSCGSAAALTDGKGSAQNMCHSRIQLATFPRFVVYRYIMDTSGTMNSCTYQYTNALIDFNGRGWLGFQLLSRCPYDPESPRPLRTDKIFLSLERNVPNPTLQLTKNTWKNLSARPKLYLPRLEMMIDNYYEGGNPTYDVGARFKYDFYGSPFLTEIATSHYDSLLQVKIDYQSPRTSSPLPCPWVVGNKLSDTVQQENSTPAKKTLYKYYPGTNLCTKIRSWVKDDCWADTIFTYDTYGNTKTVFQPDKCQQYDYDTMTMSNVIKTRTYTSPTEFFDETAEYKDSLNLALGSPSSITHSNKLISSFGYDCLGRNIRTSRGTAVDKMIEMERVSFNAIAKSLVETQYISNGLKGKDHQWCIKATDRDGRGRSVCERETLPHDLSRFIYRHTRYDVAGRVSARSQPYLNDPLRRFSEITYTYDDLSRLSVETIPPGDVGGPPVTHTFNYHFTNDHAVVQKTVADGTSTRTTTHRARILPNVDTAGQLAKFCVVQQTNEIKKTIATRFDELCRPVEIVDPRGVKMTVEYDKLSRVTHRLITSQNKPTKIISDVKVIFDDLVRKSTLRNEVAGTTAVSKMDNLGRLVNKVTQEDDLRFTYLNEYLSAISSNIGPSYTYAYDDFGNTRECVMRIDGTPLTTSFTYTTMGQPLTITNTDQSSITRQLYSDGMTVKNLALKNGSNITKASAAFADLDNQFSLPLTWTLGDGNNALTSQFQIADDGLPSLNAVSKAGTTIFEQKWKYDPLRKVKSYTSPTTAASDYGRDLSGQLKMVTKNGTCTNLKYDDSGNITEKDGGNFTNDQGWQLNSFVKDGTTLNLDYLNGNRISTKIGNTPKNTMAYDSQNRLTQLVDSERNVTTTFVYDFTGRLVKSESTAADGTKQATVYVNDNYEVDTTTPTTGNPTIKQTSYLNHNNRIASLSTVGTTEEVYYYFHDWLGSTVALFDSNGEKLSYYDYNAFGTPTASVPAKDTARYKYCGKQLFGGYYYFGARFYDSDTGRFLTQDDYPIELNGISPPSFNRYAFSLNDPVNYVDWNGNKPVVPWWHWAVDIGMIVGGLILAIWVAPVGLAIASGGLSGLITDIQAEISGENDDVGWGTQVFLGTALGFLGGFGAAPLSKLIAMGGAKVVGRYALTRSISHFALKITSKVLADATVGASLGFVQQLVTNLNDISRGAKKADQWHENLGWSTLFGGLGGAALGGAARSARKFAIGQGWRHPLHRPNTPGALAAQERFRATFHRVMEGPPLARSESLGSISSGRIEIFGI